MIVSPSQSIQSTFLWELDHSYPAIERYLIAEYESPIGISVCDRFCITGRISNIAQGIGILSSGRLVDRKYRRSSGVSLFIEDI
jgi:hypothetical protein